MSSQSFYSRCARSYFDQTFGVDPASFLLPLAEHLSPGAHILDIGCGAGRDVCWLQKRGFTCTGLDCSAALADLARRHTGLPVIEADFRTFDFRGIEMDALLLIGAMVHVPHGLFRSAFGRMLGALKPEGLVLISMKKGRSSESVADGRVFYLWAQNELLQIFHACKMNCLMYQEQESKVSSADVWMSFLLQRQY